MEPKYELMCKRMMDRLAHRGPDDVGLRQAGQTWLGHRRLSIVDVDGGHQPLANEDQTRWIVANGEIYNHLDLRKTLSSHTFRTQSDNEVILHLIEEAGPSAIVRMKGMFTFVVADSEGKLIAGRDAIGIKPLYWARQGQTVLFASEIKCFDEAWRPFVEEFPPGHYWTSDEGLVAYAKVPAPKSTPSLACSSETPSEAVLSRIRETLTRAVERRMMADVPVGVFLSGGLDSSLVASLASRIAKREGRQIHSFAVGLEDSSDLVAARKVAEFLGTCHHERMYTPKEALEIVPDVIEMMESFDPSLVQSAVANYMLAELTAAHVKVVLTGEGSDELFAGYKYHKSIESQAELHQELVRSVGDLHHLNLQRCDRTTMAHGLEARVPFLDLDFISLALSLPVEWKLHGPGQTEKWILRLAFKGYLPNSVLWREKEQFNEGSGMQSVLREKMGDTVPADEFAAERNVLTPPLATREEMAYFRLFQDRFCGVKIPNVSGRSNVAFAI
ncbi:hypothetical protein AN477_16975 [Alicyclobacillus ferrooxydans]|uniref:asparagine synthase (glutamine-hydrolyzing) n=2 Tax=Alicyclobacillus ferrooxydans TaxID=471514 RepID=A0A0P9EUC6_9BACL|nr:hypothetical protein AN477_16975 [Alicyclobacillus ferrooxydans]